MSCQSYKVSVQSLFFHAEHWNERPVTGNWYEITLQVSHVNNRSLNLLLEEIKYTTVYKEGKENKLDWSLIFSDFVKSEHKAYHRNQAYIKTNDPAHLIHIITYQS